jgi:glucosylceramidase
VQNEPEFAAPWEACAYDKEEERDFVQNHLGTMMRNDHPEVKVFIFDHNKDHAVEWTNVFSSAKEFVDGTAYHWYAGGMDRLLDGGVGSANLHRLRASVANYEKENHKYLLIGSEACHCPSTGYAGGDLKVGWARAERYAHTILADLAAGSNAWMEWNLL